MKYENLITQLCEVIKESELNAVSIYDNLEEIATFVDSSKMALVKKKKIKDLIFESFSLIQNQDLHRQKIERVVNAVCEHHDIDSSLFNIASSAKHLKGDDTTDLVSEDEIEALIKQMAN